MAHLSAPHSVAGFVSDRDAAPRGWSGDDLDGCPGFLVPDDGVENGQQFSGNGDQRLEFGFSTGDCVTFRIAPASRTTNRPLLFPLFAPDAERGALIWVESIICMRVDPLGS
jgi:hypothetical protein